jgi:2,5-diketo-D-gluconate reductase B
VNAGAGAHDGLSNFTVALMREALDRIGPGVLATNQVESALTCRTAGGRLCPRARAAPDVLHDPGLWQGCEGPGAAGHCGERHGATVAQVALAWAMQLAYAVIPSSTKREHRTSNLEGPGAALDEAEMAAIARLDRHERQRTRDGIAPA